VKWRDFIFHLQEASGRLIEKYGPFGVANTVEVLEKLNEEVELATGYTMKYKLKVPKTIEEENLSTPSSASQTPNSVPYIVTTLIDSTKNAKDKDKSNKRLSHAHMALKQQEAEEKSSKESAKDSSGTKESGSEEVARHESLKTSKKGKSLSSSHLSNSNPNNLDTVADDSSQHQNQSISRRESKKGADEIGQDPEKHFLSPRQPSKKNRKNSTPKFRKDTKDCQEPLAEGKDDGSFVKVVSFSAESPRTVTITAKSPSTQAPIDPFATTRTVTDYYCNSCLSNNCSCLK